MPFGSALFKEGTHYEVHGPFLHYRNTGQADKASVKCGTKNQDTGKISILNNTISPISLRMTFPYFLQQENTDQTRTKKQYRGRFRDKNGSMG